VGAGTIKRAKWNWRNPADLARAWSAGRPVVATAEDLSGPRDRAPYPILALRIRELGSLADCFVFFAAMVTAFLFLTRPALAQVSQQQPSSAPEVMGAQDKPGSQPPAQNSPQNENRPEPKETEKKNDRMFYVMPNYLTVDNESRLKPISWKEKFATTAKGAFDPYEFAIVGILAGIRQAENADPAFGQGMAGYGRRYGTALADQVDGNMMVGAVFPSILRTDPRYFRLGRGGFARRFDYAISRVFVTRRDSGGPIFNVPEVAGNATAIAISTVYYPAADRSFSAGINSWGVQMGLDAFGNELKEFWPDIHDHWSKKKNPSPPQRAAGD
jgi:hypothetical protein